MKKKAIERVQYIPAVRANKSYAYTASVVVADISGVEHLLIDIYTNTKEGRKRPKVRLAYTRTDWGIYRIGTGEWSAGSCYSADYSEEVWHEDDEPRQAKTFIPTDGENLIKHWTEYSDPYEDWVQALMSFEDKIKWNRQEKRYKNRQDRLAARQADTPPLPNDLKAWAERRMFQSHFLYYKRHGRYADICCSACGQVSTVCTKRSETYEGQFERIVYPKHGTAGTCPRCHKSGEWMAQGKTKGVYDITKYVYVGQQYKDNGAVIRLVEIDKMITLDIVLEGDKEIMTGAKEILSVNEIVREYIEPGKKPQRDFHKYNCWAQRDYWDDCNLSGIANITLHDGLVYDKTWNELADTCLRYSAAKEYMQGKVGNLINYAERYMQYKQLEFLVKAGFTKLVDEMVDHYCGWISDGNAANPAGFLGIYPERVKLLQSEQGDTELLRVLQREKKAQAHYSDEELETYRIFQNYGSLSTMLEHMSIIKLKHYIEKISGADIGAGMCANAHAWVMQQLRRYGDYIHMRQQLGYDLTNTIYLFPKDLKTEHDKLVLEVNKVKADKRKQEVNDRFPDIKKHYRGIRNRYYFENDEYIIRPARLAAEIVDEGRILHHCVGGNDYLTKHNTGKSYILFLRFKKDQDAPYITIEIDDTKILQWYGAYDEKPDKENIDNLLKEYVACLKGTAVAITA